MTDATFEHVVKAFYRPLYRFGRSLTRHKTEALDLTQETFRIWASKGHTLRDSNKVKGWLFTTLYREFLARERDKEIFERVAKSIKVLRTPYVLPSGRHVVDAETVYRVMGGLGRIYRDPMILFYVQGFTYHEIGKILRLPLGTVMSRLSRGKARLRRRLR